jgi:hypothetical protein
VAKPKKMSDDELGTIIQGLAADAADFVDGTLSPLRAEATKYYLGGKLGNEEAGRSQFVMTTVRDSILGVLPSALRVVFGADHPVEFVPTKAETVAQAEQATDYVRHIFGQENNGFAITHGVWKDALVRKTGIYKWSWDDTSKVTTYSLKNIPQSQLELLAQDEAVEILRITPNHPGTEPITAPVPQPEPSPELAGAEPDITLDPGVEPTFDIEVKHAEVDGCVRIWSLPPEEWLFSREGRDIETSPLVGHRTRKTTSELLALGVSQKDIDEHGGLGSELDDNAEIEARMEVLGDESEEHVEAGKANDLHEYAELYPFVDFDGDGVAELRRVCTIGPQYHVISNEPARSRPFAVFCPDPEPHTMLGQSWADRLMDLQKMQSSIVRGVADSLALSIFPRTEIVEGMVNVDDALNTEMGGLVRVKAPGQMREVAHSFVGKEAFPLLQFLEDAKEQRTGQDKGAMGLDADALQSTEKAAAGAAITAAQGQTELLVRIFCEMTLKPMFRGILGLLCEYRPKKKMVRLRGQWVEIDPRAWDANMDVTVNVALGTSLVEQKEQTLLGIAAKQELVLATYGASNPLCSPAQYANTLRKLADLRGLKDVDNYISDVPKDWQPPAPQQPAPDPAVAVKMQELEFKTQKAQTDAQLAAARLQFDQMKLQAEMEQRNADREQALVLAQEKMRLDLELGTVELELKYKTQIAIEGQRLEIEAAKEVAHNEREIANNALQHERTLAEAHHKHQHDEQKLEIEREKVKVAKKKATAKPKPKS